MLLNNIELDIKTKCIEEGTTQTNLADGVGTSPSYVSRIVKSKEHIVNKTFIAMMEQLGYDVELTYVKMKSSELGLRFRQSPLLS